MLYPDFIHVPSVSLSTLDAFEEMYSALPSSPAQTSLSDSGVSDMPRTDIYVCTHGARDCRCADLGQPLLDRLIKEARRRRIGGTWADDGRVRIAAIAHVGGHKWAGNALVYRQGTVEENATRLTTADWYGLLREEDVGQLLDLAVGVDEQVWWSRWRGRVGMTPEQVREAYEIGVSGEPAGKRRKELARKELGEPVELVFNSWDGEDEYRVKGYEGESVMVSARLAFIL